jgi:dimethylhistidine N-methyltransferase
MTQIARNDRLRLYAMDVHVHQHTFAQDVANGLAAPQKWLPPKYFYDERGSQLYEQICDLPEYYPYRAERDIFMAHAAQIHAEIEGLALVEFGSGSATKTRHLLSAYERAQQPFTYCPVDISATMLRETAAALLQTYRHIAIHAMHADFAGRPDVVQALPLERKALAFFGSSLGNFTREESAEFLRRTAAIMGLEDVFLLGIDLKKSLDILVPAYDDAQGVTAAFNLNILHRINRELGGQFDLQTFEHVALYNDVQGRIEMHLRSRQAQRIAINRIDQVVSFAAGETIHTENSYKYTVDEVRALGHQANLVLCRSWFDRQHYFLLALFRPRQGAPLRIPQE